MGAALADFCVCKSSSYIEQPVTKFSGTLGSESSIEGTVGYHSSIEKHSYTSLCPPYLSPLNAWQAFSMAA
jgi:hypothetical protein